MRKTIKYRGTMTNDEFTGYIELYLDNLCIARIVARSITAQRLHCIGAAIMYDWMLLYPFTGTIEVVWEKCQHPEIDNIDHEQLTFDEILPIVYFDVPDAYKDTVSALKECNIKLYDYLYSSYSRYPAKHQVSNQTDEN